MICDFYMRILYEQYKIFCTPILYEQYKIFCTPLIKYQDMPEIK